MDGACRVCFCCQHSPVYDMHVRIFWMCAMECMCAQTRPWFILWSDRVLGYGVKTHVNSKGNMPYTRGSDESEEGQTCDATSCRTASPTYYRLSYSSPLFSTSNLGVSPSQGSQLWVFLLLVCIRSRKGCARIFKKGSWDALKLKRAGPWMH